MLTYFHKHIDTASFNQNAAFVAPVHLHASLQSMDVVRENEVWQPLI